MSDEADIPAGTDAGEKERGRNMDKEKEEMLKALAELLSRQEKEKAAPEDPGVNYAAEYKKQTGRDLETGKYVTQ